MRWRRNTLGQKERERERKEERIEGREKRSGRKRNEREGSCRDS